MGKVLLFVLEAAQELSLQRGIFHVVYEKLGARTELRRLPHAGTRRDACRKHGDCCDPHRAAALCLHGPVCWFGEVCENSFTGDVEFPFFLDSCQRK